MVLGNLVSFLAILFPFYNRYNFDRTVGRLLRLLARSNIVRLRPTLLYVLDNRWRPSYKYIKLALYKEVLLLGPISFLANITPYPLGSIL